MLPSGHNWAARQLEKLADSIWNRPWHFLLPQLFLAVLSVWYAVEKLQFSTNRSDLISEKVKYQRDFIEYKREFHLADSLVAVVESESPVKNRRFIERLGSKLEAEPELFSNTYYKGDLRLMGPKGLLFLPEEELVELRDLLDEQWRFIETFAKAQGLDDLIRLVNRQFRETDLENFTAADLNQFVPALEALRRLLDEASQNAVHPLPNSFPGLSAIFGDQTELYLTFAGGQIYVLATHAASPEVEKEAVVRLRELVAETRDEITGVNAGISGEPVLNHDEMSQAFRDINVASGLSVVLVALIFFYGFHEILRPFLATLCLVIGIAYALGFAALTVGRLNILSITLVPILIGLAIDFGVHLISRYEEELRHGSTRREALQQAVARTGIGIFASGFTTAGAFFAMILTDFRGIAEMGFVSGAGLLLCLVPMVTVLPLLLARRTRDGQTSPVRERSRPQAARVERLCLRMPRLIAGLAIAATVLAITQFPRLDFDYNLLNLQSSGLPSVEIEEKLIRTGSESVLHGVVIADSLEDAIQLKQRLEQLEPVLRVDSIVDYLTEDQSRELQLMHEVQQRAVSLELPELSREPVDAASLSQSLFALEGYLGIAIEEFGKGNEPLRQALSTLRDSANRLRQIAGPADAETIARLTSFQWAIFNDLGGTVELLRRQDASGPLRIADMPRFLRDRYISPAGRFLLEVQPRRDLWQRSNQAEFIRAVRTVAPGVTGTIVQMYEFTGLLKQNFLQSTAYAGAVVAVILLFQFRRLSSVLIAFLPVAIGLCWMLGLMVVFGIAFNPVNIMALTLLTGIGISNGIHILNRFAEERRPAIFSDSTGKAVVVSAFTTMAGFGSLMIASHQGIASLGQVMVIGAATCMVASLVVLPALLTMLNNRSGKSDAPPA